LSSIRPKHYLKDDAIVSGVAMMSMGTPITAPDVKLDVPLDKPSPPNDNGILKIGTTITIFPARVNNLYLFSFGGNKPPLLCSPPYLSEQALRDPFTSHLSANSRLNLKASSYIEMLLNRK
jgi:hypothetical protein